MNCEGHGKFYSSCEIKKIRDWPITSSERQRKICLYFVFVGVQNTGGKGSRPFFQCPNMSIFSLTMVIPVHL